MVAVEDLRQDGCSGHLVAEVLGHHVVIDAPALVLGPRVGPEAPPAVMMGLGIEMAEALKVALQSQDIK